MQTTRPETRPKRKEGAVPDNAAAEVSAELSQKNALLYKRRCEQNKSVGDDTHRKEWVWCRLVTKTYQQHN